MELVHIRAFLVLYEERRFRRVAERLFVSSTRASQLIQELEREIGGPLFDRTSRAVTPTALGESLHGPLHATHAALQEAVVTAQARARASARTQLRLGFTTTGAGALLDDLVGAFARIRPAGDLVLVEVPVDAPFAALRAGELDVVIHWQVGDLPDLEAGPVLREAPRVLLVAAHHPLATCPSVGVEDLADQLVPALQPRDARDASVREAIIPTRTPSGRCVRAHPHPAATVAEALGLVSRGAAVWPTVAGVPALDGVVAIPIRDLPPLPLGLLHRRGEAGDDLRALCAAATAVSGGRTPAATPAAGAGRARPRRRRGSGAP